MVDREQANKSNNLTKPEQTEGPEAQLSGTQRAEANAAPQDHRSKGHRVQSCWNRSRVYFSNNGMPILALIVSAIAAIYTYKQADIAQTALVLGQRAFVHLEGIDESVADNWVSETESNGKITVFNIPQNRGKMIRSKFSFTNGGNTPTKMLQIMIYCQLVAPQTRLGDPFYLLKWDDAKVVRRSIGAKQTISVSIDTCDFKNSDVLLNAQMQIVPVFLLGYVKYEDWVDQKRPLHRTQFAHRLIVNYAGRGDAFEDMNVTTQPVGKHNCTDDDCAE